MNGIKEASETSDLKNIDDLVPIKDISDELGVSSLAVKMFCQRYQIKIYKIGVINYIESCEKGRFNVSKNGRFILHPKMLEHLIRNDGSVANNSINQ